MGENMKIRQTVLIIALLMLADPSSLLAQQRDISTVEKALLGHWRRNNGTEYYFSPEKAIIVHINGDKVSYDYTIERSNEATNVLIIGFNPPGSTYVAFYFKLEFTSGAQSLVQSSRTERRGNFVDADSWIYVNGRQAP
jgi:hypothetical protein